MKRSVNVVAALPYEGAYLGQDFIGVDRGAKNLMDQDIDMIYAVGDFDGVDQDDYIGLKSKYNVIKLNPIKNETDLEYALKKAYELRYDDIYVYGAMGKRIDHTLININLLKKYPKIKLLDEDSCVSVLPAGIHVVEADNEYPYLSMFAIKNNTIMSLENFKYPLANYRLQLDDTRCISNEVIEQGTINISEDIILIKTK